VCIHTGVARLITYMWLDLWKGVFRTHPVNILDTQSLHNLSAEISHLHWTSRYAQCNSPSASENILFTSQAKCHRKTINCLIVQNIFHISEIHCPHYMRSIRYMPCEVWNSRHTICCAPQNFLGHAMHLPWT